VKDESGYRRPPALPTHGSDETGCPIHRVLCDGWENIHSASVLFIELAFLSLSRRPPALPTHGSDETGCPIHRVLCDGWENIHSASVLFIELAFLSLSRRPGIELLLAGWARSCKSRELLAAARAPCRKYPFLAAYWQMRRDVRQAHASPGSRVPPVPLKTPAAMC
jgi:hypothetical protein